MQSDIWQFMFSSIGKWVTRAGFFLAPLAISAAVPTGALEPQAPLQSLNDVKLTVFCATVDWIFTGAIIISVIFVLIAAYRYMLSGGNEDKIKEVHKALIYVVVGIAVAIVARGTPFIVNSFFEINVAVPPIAGGGTTTVDLPFGDPCAVR